MLKWWPDEPFSSVCGTPSVAVFDRAVFDTGGFWSAAAPELLTVPAGLEGLYLVAAGVFLKGGAVDGGVWMDVRVDAPFFPVCGQSGLFRNLGFTPTVAVLSCSALVRLEPGQSLRLAAYGWAGSGAVVGGSIDLTYLSLVKLD